MPDPVRGAATTSWIQRESRECRILAGGGVVPLFVIIYLVLWEPAFEGQRRIEKALPQMRIQLVEMETLGQEARDLSAIAAAPVLHGAELEQVLNASLTNRGLKTIRMVMSDESVQVQLDEVLFGVITEWLQEMRQAQYMEMIDTNIKYVDTMALVSMMATLQDPAAPGR